jgi:hypothetical protein
MKPLTIHIALLVLLFPTFMLAQETPTLSKDKIMESIAESMAGDLNENADLSGILEELEEFISHPLDINTATAGELEKLRFLNSTQIENLLNYRKRNGQIFSLYELQLIDGFNVELAEKTSLFTSIEAPEKKEFNYLQNEVTLRTQYTFEKASGFIANENGVKRFSGIQPKLYLKYKGEKDGRWNWGLTAENDAGEPFFSGNNKAGFDFYSGFVAWSGKKLVKRIIAGDFQAKTGQGLLFWSGYGGMKSIDGAGARYSGQGIRPYSSSTEYGFFRGVAAEFETGKFDLVAFYSNRNADANVSGFDENGEPITVSSILELGYHRTENEIADKRSLNIQTTGLGARFSKNRFSTAINAGYQHFNLPIEPNEQLYNQYYFRGKDNYCISADAHQAFKNATLFGEIALSRSGGTALLAGIEASPASEIGFTVLFRDYKKDFQSIGGNPFSEFGTTSNERGIYSGVNLFVIPRVTLTTYLDLYESYWVKYTSLRPVKGNDFALQANWSVSKHINLQVKFKTETRNENSSLPSIIKTDADETTKRIRLTTEWQPSEKLSLRFRSEWNGISKEDSLLQGWLLFVDATTRLLDDRITATARLAWYDTDHYNSGVRAYENDLPQSFNFPVYYLNGLRYYLNLSYRISNAVSLYLKLSQTRLAEEHTTIGSGDLQIAGNKKTELKFQMRIKF